MRIFNTFLILLVVALLWMLPVTSAIYDFRTDVRTDTFRDTDTGVGVTTATVTLLRFIYDDDSETVELYSDLETDNATVSSYNSTTKVLSISNLTANTTRDLEVSYDIGALSENDALDTFLNILPMIWILVLFIFPAVSLWVVWRR